MTSVDYFSTFPVKSLLDAVPTFLLKHFLKNLVICITKTYEKSAYFPNLAGIIADMTLVTCYHVSASSGLRREINAASDPISAFVFRCQMKISGRWVADLWYLLQALYLFSGGISVSQYLLLRGPLLSWAMLPNISIHRPILCYVPSASRLEPGP